MYVRLIVAGIAAVFLILLAKKHPILATVIYIFALIYFVGFSSGRGGFGGISIRFPLPFWRAIKNHHYGLATNRSVLNVILFIPFGSLLPALFSALSDDEKEGKKLKLWMVIAIGFGCSLLIESSQYLFNRGVFELDDLVKNTMGAAVGWLIWKGINLKQK